MNMDVIGKCMGQCNGQTLNLIPIDFALQYM